MTKKKWEPGDLAMIVPQLTPCVIESIGTTLIGVRLGTKSLPGAYKIVSPIQLAEVPKEYEA